jgi:alcohol dehydrogenase/L-iditol 2-dehydrogenase
MCRTGRYNLCPSRKGFGYGINGAMADYVRVPERCLHHVPDGLPFEIACLTEPHCVAYNAMCVNATIRPGDTVVVLGPGPIGLLCARMAALSGADPLIVAGLSADTDRLRVARELGATHTVNLQAENLEEIVRSLSPIGADLVCDASGASRPLEAALRLVRPDGEVVKVGWSPDNIAVDMNPLVQRNVRLQGSFSHNWPIWERVLHLLDRGLTKAELIVGMTTGLEGWREAFTGMHEGRIIKAVLVPDREIQ